MVMHRVLVLGSSGSGKTTFLRQLAELLDIEADIESSLDDLFGSDDLTDDLFS